MRMSNDNKAMIAAMALLSVVPVLWDSFCWLGGLFV